MEGSGELIRAQPLCNALRLAVDGGKHDLVTIGERRVRGVGLKRPAVPTIRVSITILLRHVKVHFIDSLHSDLAANYLTTRGWLDRPEVRADLLSWVTGAFSTLILLTMLEHLLLLLVVDLVVTARQRRVFPLQMC